MKVRWPKVIAILLCTIVVILHLLGDMGLNTRILYAHRVVFNLERHRTQALQSDISEAAQILQYVHEGSNAKQTPNSRLDQICSLERTNVIREIIAYLRTKTGEDLGPMPEPWIGKYRSKDPRIAEPDGSMNGKQPLRSETNRTSTGF
jgi:hypothetical protein